MKYQMCYLAEVVRKHIPLLSPRARDLIKKAMEDRLMVDPIGFGKPLRYSLKGHRPIRVSDYMVVYRIYLESKTVIIVAIKHRKDVYEE